MPLKLADYEQLLPTAYRCLLCGCDFRAEEIVTKLTIPAKGEHTVCDDCVHLLSAGHRDAILKRLNQRLRGLSFLYDCVAVEDVEIETPSCSPNHNEEATHHVN